VSLREGTVSVKKRGEIGFLTKGYVRCRKEAV